MNLGCSDAATPKINRTVALGGRRIHFSKSVKKTVMLVCWVTRFCWEGGRMGLGLKVGSGFKLLEAAS